MLHILTTSEFEADFRRMTRLGKDTTLFWELVALPANQELIPTEYRDRELSGRWRGIRDIDLFCNRRTPVAADGAEPERSELGE